MMLVPFDPDCICTYLKTQFEVVEPPSLSPHSGI